MMTHKNAGDRNPSKGGEPLRWHWLVGCFAGGAVLTVSAFFVPSGWDAQTPSVLVNLGTALGLAGILFLLERRFSGEVFRASERAASQVATQVEERFERRAKELSSRLDSVQAQVEEGLRQRAAEQNSAVRDFVEDVSYGSTTRMLSAANRLGAINNGVVTVPGSMSLSGLKVSFGWGISSKNSRDSSSPQLVVAVQSRSDDHDHGSAFEVRWQANQSASEIGQSIAEELIRRGLWNGSETVDWALALENLRYVVATAMAARRRDPEASPLKGQAIELVNHQWIVTSAGVEHPSRQFVLTSDRFNDNHIEPPDWADAEEWKRVIGLARKHHPRRSDLLDVSIESWQPWMG